MPPNPAVGNHSDGVHSNVHGGPATLLALDPATLAIRASSDSEKLQKLNTFALELQHYVGLVQAQRQQQVQPQQVAGVAMAETTTTGSAAVDWENNGDDAASAIDMTAEDDVPEEKPAAASSLGKGQKSDENSIVGMERNDIVKREGEENNDNDMGKDGGNNVVVRHHTVKEEYHPDGSMDPRAESSTPGRPLKRVKRDPPNSTPSIQDCCRHPRQYAIYDGSLERSTLARSEGRTRQVLNVHLAKLGLTAKFSNGVLSKRGTRVSHLTLQNKWNDLPQDRLETLEWWLGQGVKRLELASFLDPSKYPQSSVAVFWAEPRTNGGPALCHYVGHYKCIGFVPGMRLIFKSEPRQALIEFRFCRFDAKLAKTIASL